MKIFAIALLAGALFAVDAHNDAHWDHPSLVEHRKETHRKLLSACERRNRNLQSASCIVHEELTEGPYWWDQTQVRQDIREDRQGVEFNLNIQVINASTCEPIANVGIEIWHCDALGDYSHYLSGSQSVTDNSTFLRGMQITDDDGNATFTTIYPGYYTGRADHIHLKIHTGVSATNSGYQEGVIVHVGQIFPPDDITDIIVANSPYKETTNQRTYLTEDDIFQSVSDSGAVAIDVREATPGAGYPAGVIGYATIIVGSSDVGSGSGNGGDGGDGGNGGPGTGGPGTGGPGTGGPGNGGPGNGGPNSTDLNSTQPTAVPTSAPTSTPSSSTRLAFSGSSLTFLILSLMNM